jgi:uncharacterized membrane protein
MQQRGYTGRYESDDSHFVGEQGEKIHDDSDEQFADMLVRRIKSELEQEKSSFMHARLLLAIVSVAALVILFGLLVLALLLGVTKASDGASIGLGWGFIIVCWVIGYVNYAFNKGSNQGKNNKSEKQNP